MNEKLKYSMCLQVARDYRRRFLIEKQKGVPRQEVMSPSFRYAALCLVTVGAAEGDDSQPVVE